MKRAYFESLEHCASVTELDLSEVTNELGFDSQGLVPVITQDASSKEVLMLAWMNKAALTETLATGYVTYWSRSRNQLWVKGETSSHTQRLVSLSIDCDGDAVLCQVNQTGAACHTGRMHCFYIQADTQRQTVRVVDS
ncbi:MAG: phosphoribosyl-AMP cyclohydrolase [Gammaproteobacteria bacterium]|jgi:phosphoribosyl-AMP cyclohydrolase